MLGRQGAGPRESLAHARFGGLTGLRFNIGRVEGGIKANMIARAELRFGFRPLPSMDIDALLATFAGFAEPAAAHSRNLPRPEPAIRRHRASRGAPPRRARRRRRAGLAIGNAVDFWTEASLFSAGGYTAFVYGPGDIAQAHTADEFVTLEQLQRYAESVNRINAGA
jgi:acetylornithine deacetylase